LLILILLYCLLLGIFFLLLPLQCQKLRDNVSHLNCVSRRLQLTLAICYILQLGNPCYKLQNSLQLLNSLLLILTYSHQSQLPTSKFIKKHHAYPMFLCNVKVKFLNPRLLEKFLYVNLDEVLIQKMWNKNVLPSR
jgi:hypothetical protein